MPVDLIVLDGPRAPRGHHQEVLVRKTLQEPQRVVQQIRVGITPHCIDEKVASLGHALGHAPIRMPPGASTRGSGASLPFSRCRAPSKSELNS
jgi:hypothetical protein